MTWKDRITKKPVDCSSLTGTSSSPNIDSAWNHANGADGTIIDGFDTELLTKKGLMGLLLCEKKVMLDYYKPLMMPVSRRSVSLQALVLNLMDV